MEFSFVFSPQEQKLLGLEDRPYTQGEMDSLRLMADGVSRSLCARDFELEQHKDGVPGVVMDELNRVRNQKSLAVPLLKQLDYLADFPQQ